MNKCYYRIVWKNYPDDRTPLNEQNLNRIEVAADEMDNRIISLDSTKFDKSEAQLLVKYIEYDEDTGIFKITHYNGASYTIDTLLEKLAINFDYDYQTQRLIIELSDGEKKYVDLSALITQYEFLDSDTVHFTISTNGKVTADIIEGSIGEKHLRPDYLADIRVESAKAEASATAAAKSEAASKVSQTESKKSETAAKASEEAAAEYAREAADSAAVSLEESAKAAASAAAAKASEDAAAGYAEDAKVSEESAEANRVAAAASAAAAAQDADDAKKHATEAESFTHGGTGTRDGEDTDNAEHYYEQMKYMAERVSNALVPMGTVTFEQLMAIADAKPGDTYNISDEFVTTDVFKEGAGRVVPLGSNVYMTEDGYWDVLAGTPVSKVNGQTGNVEVNLGNITGVLPVSKGGTGRQSASAAFNLLANNAFVASDGYGLADLDSLLFLQTSVESSGAYRVPFLNLWTYIKNKLASRLMDADIALAPRNASSFSLRSADGNYGIALHMGASGANRGLLDPISDTWILFKDAGGNVNLRGSADMLQGKVARDFMGINKLASAATIDEPGLPTGFYNIENAGIGFEGYGSYHSVLNMGEYSGNDFRSQIDMPYQNTLTDTEMFIRTAIGSVWRDWRRVVHSGNIGEQIVKAAYKLQIVDKLLTSSPNDLYNDNGFSFRTYKYGSVGLPTDLASYVVLNLGEGDKATQIAITNSQYSGSGNNAMLAFLRSSHNTGLNDNWVEFITSSNYARFCDGRYPILNASGSVGTNINVNKSLTLQGDKSAFIAKNANGATTQLKTESSYGGLYTSKGDGYILRYDTSGSGTRPNVYLLSSALQAYVESGKKFTLYETSSSGVSVYGHFYAASYDIASSSRYKENIEDLSEEEAKKILELRSVSYDYKEEFGGEKSQFGLIAEEVDDLIPSTVSKNADGQPDGIDYSKFVPHLIKMIQMQESEIKELKSRIEKLEVANNGR